MADLTLGRLCRPASNPFNVDADLQIRPAILRPPPYTPAITRPNGVQPAPSKLLSLIVRLTLPRPARSLILPSRRNVTRTAS